MLETKESEYFDGFGFQILGQLNLSIPNVTALVSVAPTLEANSLCFFALAD